jgi:hypothetical protein
MTRLSNNIIRKGAGGFVMGRLSGGGSKKKEAKRGFYYSSITHHIPINTYYKVSVITLIEIILSEKGGVGRWRRESSISM